MKRRRGSPPPPLRDLAKEKELIEPILKKPAPEGSNILPPPGGFVALTEAHEMVAGLNMSVNVDQTVTQTQATSTNNLVLE